MIFKIIDFIKVTLEYLIFPPICPMCHEFSEERNMICKKCAEKLSAGKISLEKVPIKKIDIEKFSIKKIPIENIIGKKFLRLNYKNKPAENLQKVFCIANYREGSRNILLNMKFNNDLSGLPILKKVLHSVADNENLKNFLAEIDIATFVPLHEERLKERGYNQVDLIFRDFLTAQNIQIENLLIRSKNTVKLFDLKPAERKEMMKDAFIAAENIDVQGKKILIVDDIYTTGSTVSECAKVLKSHGAEKIFVLAFSSDGD